MFTVNYHYNEMPHQVALANMFKGSDIAEDIKVRFYQDNKPRQCDVAICWSFHYEALRNSPTPCLVLENGLVDSDRYVMLSLNNMGMLSPKFAGTPCRANDLKEYAVTANGKPIIYNPDWEYHLLRFLYDTGDLLVMSGKPKGRSSGEGSFGYFRISSLRRS